MKSLQYPRATLLWNILKSRQTGLVILRYVVLFSLLIVSLSWLPGILHTFRLPAIYNKDFIQEYLLGKALLNRTNPYLPLEQLAQRFLTYSLPSVFPHPAAYPPPVALLSLPFAIFSYEQAAVAWFFGELICIYISVNLVLRWLGKKPGLIKTLVYSFFVFAFLPLDVDLTSGQFGPFLFVLLFYAYQSLETKNDVLAGSLLGLAITLKLIFWPIIVFLILRKNWRAVVTAAVTFSACNLISGIIIGFDRWLYYYLKVGSLIASTYQTDVWNFPLWTIGWRLFKGTGGTWDYGISAPPLISAPFLANLTGFILAASGCLIGIIMAYRTKRLDISFAMLIIVSLLISPVLWYHYLVLALIPMLIVCRHLYSLGLPKWDTYVAFMIACLLCFSSLDAYIWSLFVREPVVGLSLVSLGQTLITLLPTIELIILFWLTWRLDKVYDV